MAIWLVVRALGAALPRRLVYVVNRRAVVDQATEVAERLRDCVRRDAELKHALALEDRSLPISTLRDQHVGKREWLEELPSQAITVGTVEMIGSWLLFEGGTTRIATVPKVQPQLHALSAMEQMPDHVGQIVCTHRAHESTHGGARRASTRGSETSVQPAGRETP